MRPDEFSKMRALEDTNWWFRGRRYLLRGLLSKLGLRDALVLDAGCGTGFAGGELRRAGTVVGLDASAEALDGSEAKLDGACVASVERTPFGDEVFDLIVAMDLLEHLEDESRALREIGRICRPGGYVFVTVPAYRCLWSRHDEALGHRRRYTRPQIVSRLREAGFATVKSSYFVTTVLPAAAVFRMIRRWFGRESTGTDLFPVPEPFNAVLSAIMRAESGLVWSVGLPFGLTAWVLARKGESDQPPAARSQPSDGKGA